MQMVVNTDSGANIYDHLHREGQVSTIWRSIEERNFDEFQSLIKKSGDINQKNPKNCSLVSFALHCNAYQILEELIRLGATITENDVNISFEKRDRQYSKLILNAFIDQSEKNFLEKTSDKINQMSHKQMLLSATPQKEKPPLINNEEHIGVKDKIKTMEQQLQSLEDFVNSLSAPHFQEQVEQKEKPPLVNNEEYIGVKDKIKTMEQRMQNLKDLINLLPTSHPQEQVEQKEKPPPVNNKKNIGVKDKIETMEQRIQGIARLYAEESKEERQLASEIESHGVNQSNPAQKFKDGLDDVGLSGILVNLIKHRFFK
ncbi:MAG: hypothetical protein AAF443_08015 [Chlamydiota bacterium]